MKEVNGFIVTSLRSWGLLQENEKQAILATCRYPGTADCSLWRYAPDQDKWLNEYD